MDTPQASKSGDRQGFAHRTLSSVVDVPLSSLSSEATCGVGYRRGGEEEDRGRGGRGGQGGLNGLSSFCRSARPALSRSAWPDSTLYTTPCHYPSHPTTASAHICLAHHLFTESYPTIQRCESAPAPSCPGGVSDCRCCHVPVVTAAPPPSPPTAPPHSPLPCYIVTFPPLLSLSLLRVVRSQRRPSLSTSMEFSFEVHSSYRHLNFLHPDCH